MELDRIGGYIKEIQKGGRLLVVTDTNVAPLYLARCEASLQKAGFRTDARILPAGEETKNGETFLWLLNECADLGLTRSDGIVALGGGMVGDLAGFTAACYLRGIRVIQVPTTLLAAVDSSVGGKTAIDLPAGKNLAGAFHQPALVVQDAALLASLPEAVYRDGMAEVVKYGIIADEALFQRLRDPAQARAEIAGIIRDCVAIKQRIVEEDEFDTGVRHLLNFGHTLGHAIELLSAYQLSHGYAVAKGMDLMARISYAQGWCAKSDRLAVREILTAYGFDLTPGFPPEALFNALLSDKKRTGDVIRIVGLDRIGACSVKPLALSDFREMLEIIEEKEAL